MNHHENGDKLTVDHDLASVLPDRFDALVLPGGVANPDALRIDAQAVAFVRHFVEAGKPIAAHQQLQYQGQHHRHEEVSRNVQGCEQSKREQIALNEGGGFAWQRHGEPLLHAASIGRRLFALSGHCDATTQRIQASDGSIAINSARPPVSARHP